MVLKNKQFFPIILIVVFLIVTFIILSHNKGFFNTLSNEVIEPNETPKPSSFESLLIKIQNWISSIIKGFKISKGRLPFLSMSDDIEYK